MIMATMEELNSLTKFRQHLESIGNFQWLASERELQKLKTYLYDNTETARTIDQLMAAGWDSLITPTLKRHGVCYDLAAALDFTFKRAGYTSRVIYTWHNSHHYWVQVLIDGFWWNYDPTYGMNRCHITIAEASAKDKAAGGPGYTERGYVDAVYDKKGAMISAKYTPVQ